MSADERAVAGALKNHERALNASDVAALMKLYASDGVFMTQNSPSSRRACEAVFAAIRLNVEFRVAEVRQLAANWVLARTNSARGRRWTTGPGGLL